MTSPPASLRPSVTTSRTLGDLAEALGGEVGDEHRDVVVTGVTAGSRDVRSGDLFVAVPGAQSHGARYAEQAVAAGAAAILTDDAGAELLRAASDEVRRVPVAVARLGRSLVSRAAVWFYDAPADSLTTFAVTGTNGKTTTTYLLDHLLRAAGRTVGLVGTVETRSGTRVLPSKLTTPDAAALQGVLATMREDEVDTLAMEVSSHSLVQERVAGIAFDVAGFTNLTQDHLDFHGDLEEYFLAKRALFTPAHARRGVVLVDDAWGARLAEEAEVPVVTVSLTGQRADWSVRDIEEAPGRTTFTLVGPEGIVVSTSTTLPGLFNVANAALALVMVAESELGVAALTSVLEQIDGLDPAVPGRMEQVSTTPRVVVDFAHNPDALGLALKALRPSTEGRLIIVFGATGERDTGKRPIMGEVAVNGADVVVVTDDDPHGEDAALIRAGVLAGARAAAEQCQDGRNVLVLEESPRASAIRAAVLAADDEDTVLVAGRGHEVWQEINGVDHPLDDRVEARQAVAERAQVNMKEHSE